MDELAVLRDFLPPFLWEHRDRLPSFSVGLMKPQVLTGHAKCDRGGDQVAGLFVGRWSEERSDYPRWSDDGEVRCMLSVKELTQQR